MFACEIDYFNSVFFSPLSQIFVSIIRRKKTNVGDYFFLFCDASMYPGLLMNSNRQSMRARCTFNKHVSKCMVLARSWISKKQKGLPFRRARTQWRGESMYLMGFGRFCHFNNVLFFFFDSNLGKCEGANKNFFFFSALRCSNKNHDLNIDTCLWLMVIFFNWKFSNNFGHYIVFFFSRRLSLRKVWQSHDFSLLHRRFWTWWISNFSIRAMNE